MIELLLQAERALSVGLLDRAETLYGQVAAADPRNSIAVVGLARVALDRGDEDAALELARRALTIDPENVAAQRLVQRLEEVRAYRGNAASSPAPEHGPAPESETAREPEAEPTTAPGPGTAPESAALESATPVSERGPDSAPTTPGPGPTPAAPATAAPPPRRRSWLERFFRRNC